MPVREFDLRAHHACSLLQTGPCPDIRISEAVLPKRTPRTSSQLVEPARSARGQQEARASLARQASSSLSGLISHVCRALCCRQDATEGEPCAAEGECTAKRAALPAPFKSSTCSTDSVRSWCFRSKIVPEMCLTRFRERDDRARGEALDLMETRQLLATGNKVRFRDDRIAAVDRLRLVPDHLHRNRSRHARALKVSHRTPSQVMLHDAGATDLSAGRSPCAIEVLDRISLLTEEDRPRNNTRGMGEGFCL